MRRSVTNSLLRIMLGFGAARGGNIALIFALLLTPLLIAGGIAIDLGRSGQADAVTQEAADAAALRAARAKTQNPLLTDEDLTALARKVFNAALAKASWIDVSSFKVVFNSKTQTVGLSFAGELDTSLMQIVGVRRLPVSVASEVRIGEPPLLEIALSLDVTGSMNQKGKLADMKRSASDLVEQTLTANPKAKIGLVPFAQYANVGESMAGQAWLDAPQKAFFGCVGSRFYPANLIDGDYDVKPVPGLTGNACPDPIVGLTSDKTKIVDAIEKLDANGWTYIPAGLAWGWRVLSAQAPFTGGVTYDEMRKVGALKVLVLLTDGDNTRAPDYPTHNSQDKSLADNLMTALCDNIKKDGIVVYTIAFDVSDPGIRGLLEKCATTPGYYFDPETDDQLAAAFGSITSSLRTLSLTK